MSRSGFNELINFFRQITSNKRSDYQEKIDKLYDDASIVDDKFSHKFSEYMNRITDKQKKDIFSEYKKGKTVFEIVFNLKITERAIIQLFADKIKSEHLKIFVDYDLYHVLEHQLIDAWLILRTAELILSDSTCDVVSICSFNIGMAMLPSQLIVILSMIDVFNHNYSSFSPDARSRLESLFLRLKMQDSFEFDLSEICDRTIKRENNLNGGDDEYKEALDDLTLYIKALDIEKSEFYERHNEISDRIKEENLPMIDLSNEITIFDKHNNKLSEKIVQLAEGLHSKLKEKVKYPRYDATGEYLYELITNISIGQEVYVRVIHNDVTNIYLGEIKDCKERFTVKLKNNTITPIKEVSVDRPQLGFAKPLTDYRYPVGTRVMALFTPRTKDEKAEFKRNAVWLPGTVGGFESGEYLIFFDLDIDAYVEMNKVMLHFDQAFTKKRNDDDLPLRVEPRENYKKVNSIPRLDFLKRYLCDKVPPPIYEGKIGESLRAKDGRRRYKATIIQIKGVLYLLRFPKNDRTSIQDQGHDCMEFNCVKHNHADRWVYKGSTTRLDIPETSKAERRRQQIAEDLEILEEEDSLMKQTARKSSTTISSITTRTNMARAAVNKQTEAKKKKAQQIKKVELKAPKWENILDWKEHDECTEDCLKSRSRIIDSYSNQWSKVVSPYFKPIIKGWTRIIFKVGSIKSKKSFSSSSANRKDYVYYISPCGRRLHDFIDIAIHLRITNSPLPIMWFNLRSALDPEWIVTLDQDRVLDKDFSLGMEGAPIPVVNNVDNQPKPRMIYNYTRFARSEAVNKIIEESRNARSCCTCTDNCSDKNRCECQRLTMIEHNRLDKQLQGPVNSYDYGTLEYQVGSGIYECNSKCLCNKDKCFNYVSQRKIEIPIALFMTAQSGWGVRALVDIPLGSYISTYSGEILTDEMVEELGEKEGAGRDMYYADMDFYRTMEEEKLKRGFDLPDEGIEEDVPDETTIMRKHFNQDHPFTIDAFLEGNIGRFYNHSCNPNMFVQNVFTDTHDFRFPVITFFAAQDIAAGAELTWNYNYENHQRVKCYCGASNCRGFLM